MAPGVAICLSSLRVNTVVLVLVILPNREAILQTKLLGTRLLLPLLLASDKAIACASSMVLPNTLMSNLTGTSLTIIGSALLTRSYLQMFFVLLLLIVNVCSVARLPSDRLLTSEGLMLPSSLSSSPSPEVQSTTHTPSLPLNGSSECWLRGSTTILLAEVRSAEEG